MYFGKPPGSNFLCEILKYLEMNIDTVLASKAAVLAARSSSSPDVEKSGLKRQVSTPQVICFLYLLTKVSDARNESVTLCNFKCICWGSS